MKRNIGDIDAVIRIMIGFVLAYCYYISTMPTVWHTLGLVLAGLLMLTAVHGNDPLYRLISANTCKGNSCGACAKKPEDNHTC